MIVYQSKIQKLKGDCRTMCDSLQIYLVGAVSTNILTPYGVKTAFAGKSGKYCVKFLRNWVLQNTYFATPHSVGI